MSIFNRRWGRFLLIVLGGLLTACTVMIPEIGIFEWIAMIPAALILITVVNDKKVRLRGMYGYGFLYFMCYYAVLYNWLLYLYPLSFAGLDKGTALFVAIFSWIGLPLFQSSIFAFSFVILKLVCKCKLVSENRILIAPLYASIYCLFEWQQTIGWTGVPWARLAIGQTQFLDMIQTSSLFGTYFISFLIVVVNLLLAYAIICSDKRRFAVSLACCLLAFNATAGALIFEINSHDDGEGVVFAAVQGNVSSHEEWDMSNRYDVIMERYSRLTKEAVAAGAEVVVWPETAMPYDIGISPSVRGFLKDLADECSCILVVGVFTRDEDDRLANSVVTIYPNGDIDDTVYVKRKLVPFGEFVPMEEIFNTLIPQLSQVTLLEENLKAGTQTSLVNSPYGRWGSLICFDSIYEEYSRNSVYEGAELLLVSTNDALFRDSIETHMHNAQAKLRAVENGRYIVRAANTGVSSIISPTGKTLASVDPMIEGQITQTVYMRDELTLYTRIGDVFLVACALFVFALPISSAVMGLARKLKKRQDITDEVCS